MQALYVYLPQKLGMLLRTVAQGSVVQIDVSISWWQDLTINAGKILNFFSFQKPVFIRLVGSCPLYSFKAFVLRFSC